MTDRQKREECCRQSGSCGSGKPSNPSHQHAPLGTIHCGFAKNLPDFRSPNTIVFYFRLFKERLRIRNIAWTKLTIFPDMKVMCPKVLFLEPYFGFRVIRLGRHRLIFSGRRSFSMLYVRILHSVFPKDKLSLFVLLWSDGADYVWQYVRILLLKRWIFFHRRKLYCSLSVSGVCFGVMRYQIVSSSTQWFSGTLVLLE